MPERFIPPSGYPFDLLKMVHVVPRHSFDDGLNGHLAALGVGELLREIGGRNGVEESEIPAAGGLEDLERGAGVEAGVGHRPGVLVEGLDDVVRLGERLAEAESEDDLAIGEVAKDFGGAPLAGRGNPFEAIGAEAIDLCGEFGRCLGDYSKRVQSPQK